MSNAAGLKIVFAGTPDFAATHLKSLLQSHHTVVSVYTQPDRPAGRGKKLTPSPVKQVAQEANLTVHQPLHLKDEEQQRLLAEQGADVMVVVAYGLLLPANILTTPRLGCINVHASLLPRWRGAAPIQRAIEAGDEHTGITIMQMDVGLDTGDMLNITQCPIHATDTAGTLHDRLASLGPDALLQTLAKLQDGTATAEKQDDKHATYAHKLSKAEALIDWNKPAQDIHRSVRAFNPFPVAYTTKGEDRIRVFAGTVLNETTNASPGSIINHTNGITVACGNGTCLQLDQLQLPGKKAMQSKDILNGFAHMFSTQTILGSQ